MVVARWRSYGSAIVAVWLGLTSGLLVQSAETWQPAAQFRRPISIVVDNEWCYTANRDCGTVSVIDTAEMRVVTEIPVGRHLSALELAPDRQTLLALDDHLHQLIELSNAGPNSRVLASVTLPVAPVTLAFSPKGDRASVASLWARQLTLLGLSQSAEDGAPRWQVTKTIDLDYAPRLQLFCDDNRSLIVADAFGGGMTLIDWERQAVVGRRTIDGHNLRGLAFNGRRDLVLVAHQMLNERMVTERNRVFWGDVMGNVLRGIRVADLWEMDESSRNDGEPDRSGGGRREWSSSPVAHWTMYPLGEPSNAAGDPGTIVATESEWTIVLLGGTNEIAVRHGDRQVFTRHRVGRRPVDAAISADQSSVFVANMFDDSASVIRLEDRELITTISLGTHPPPSLAQQGEVLFHDASLSLDRWYSCHSCHTDGHTNGLSNDNFGDTQAGAPKRVPSLLGTRDTGPWAWDGHQRELRNQIRSSILTTMQGEPERSATDENLRAIEAYLHTLTPPPGIDVARMRVADSRVAEGRLVFENRGCVDCHQASIFTSNDTYDIGMPDENGKRRFNPPSLLGVSQRDSYFHDGRVDTLRAAITDTPHGERFVLSGQEIEDLLAYLRSL